MCRYHKYNSKNVLDIKTKIHSINFVDLNFNVVNTNHRNKQNPRTSCFP